MALARVYPPKKKPPRPRVAQGGQSLDGSSATLEDQYSKASAEDRRCDRCSNHVRNQNLGGHNGRPLSGPVYCLNCADDVRALSRHLGRVLRVQIDNVLTGACALRGTP
jgi:hypothetical protein